METTLDVPPEVLELGVRLTESAARNTATAITDKVRALRAAAKSADTIAGLEEIVNDLIADKSELTRIAQSYQAELVSQRRTAGDVKYIADTVVPLLEDLVEKMDESQREGMKKALTALKPLLSVETANVLQILGFDFRKAIGAPLTHLVENAILSRVNQSESLQVEQMRAQQALVQLARDPDATARFQALIGR